MSPAGQPPCRYWPHWRASSRTRPPRSWLRGSGFWTGEPAALMTSSHGAPTTPSSGDGLGAVPGIPHACCEHTAQHRTLLQGTRVRSGPRLVGSKRRRRPAVLQQRSGGQGPPSVTLSAALGLARGPGNGATPAPQHCACWGSGVQRPRCTAPPRGEAHRPCLLLWPGWGAHSASSACKLLRTLGATERYREAGSSKS